MGNIKQYRKVKIGNKTYSLIMIPESDQTTVKIRNLTEAEEIQALIDHAQGLVTVQGRDVELDYENLPECPVELAYRIIQDNR